MITTRRMYCCFVCHTAYCHPIKRCYNCPTGKLVPRDLPYDWEKPEKERYVKGFFEGWLKDQGFKFGGI